MLTSKQSSQAFLATKAAPSIILGLEVLVQLVIAAITTSPCLSSAVLPRKLNSTTLVCDFFGIAKPCVTNYFGSMYNSRQCIRKEKLPI